MKMKEIMLMIKNNLIQEVEGNTNEDVKEAIKETPMEEVEK